MKNLINKINLVSVSGFLDKDTGKIYYLINEEVDYNRLLSEEDIKMHYKKGDRKKDYFEHMEEIRK